MTEPNVQISVGKRPPVVAILVAIVFLVACCGIAESLNFSNQKALRDTYDYVIQTLKPGMSQQQVYDVFNHAGPHEMAPLSRDICSQRQWILSERKLVRLHGDWLYWYHMDLYVCFDDSGSLIYFEILS